MQSNLENKFENSISLEGEEVKDDSLSTNLLEEFAQKLVLSNLLKMNRGLLRVTLPGGEVVQNQSTDCEIEAEIKINSHNFFLRCVRFGAIGFAESFIANEWTTENLTDVISWFILNSRESTVMEGSSKRSCALDLFRIFNRVSHLFRSNSKTMARKNISAHYDLSNELFETFLDRSMTYSSALFLSKKESLESAQLNKYERLCRSLKLEKTDHLLEIGCGWGGFAVHAAKNYGCLVTAITISREQYEYASERVAKAGLTDHVKILLKDFRDLEGKFDKIVSIEMMEALGDEHVDTFFSRCHHLLTDNGLMSLQMISSPDSRYDLLRGSVDFIQKHIFPGSLLLSIERVVRATRKTSDFHILELHDFAESYALTLKIWRENFSRNIDRVRVLGFDESFIRKWLYYFSYCEAAFAMRQISVVQITLTRPNNQFLAKERNFK